MWDILWEFCGRELKIYYNSVVNWSNYLFLFFYLVSHIPTILNPIVIRDPGLTVKIDQSLLSNGKIRQDHNDHNNRYLKRFVVKQAILFAVLNSSVTTLMTILRKSIRPVTGKHTDQWTLGNNIATLSQS